MKKTFIKTISLVCTIIMVTLTLFSCNANQNTEKETTVSNVHTVKFNSNGGTVIPDMEIRHGQKISEPTPPTRENYIFLRWEQETRPWIFSAMTVTEDVTLNAMWISASELFKTVSADNPDELLISGFKAQKNVYNLIIPEKINGKTVVGFTNEAFKDIHDEHADHLTVPATVRSVGDSAFQNIAKVHLTFLGEINSLGVSSFEYCSTFKTIKLSNGLTYIPYRCFFAALSLVTIDIPEGVTLIEENAFSSCTAMQTIVLPSTLETIEDGAFVDSSNLAVLFYKGTEEQFDKIKISANNNELLSAKLYFYSEAQPTDGGDFWHYDNNGAPILWE